MTDLNLQVLREAAESADHSFHANTVLALLDEIDRLRKWPCRQDLRPGETICHQCHCHVPLLRSFDSASKKFKATCHCGALIWFHDHPPSEGFADDPARSRIEELGRALTEASGGFWTDKGGRVHTKGCAHDH